MNFLGIIPARYSSTRFPGKPLVNLGNKTIIEWVYTRSAEAVDEIYVATDDKRIFDEVNSFGGNVIMTSEKHQTGTDRCREAMDSIISGTGYQVDAVINIQGDEPFIRTEQINLLKACFNDPETHIATLVKLIEHQEDIFNENLPKVVLDNKSFALYFSRSPIPFIRNRNQKEWLHAHRFFRHLGIYAYKKDVLREITDITPASLETAESLEQLRWLQNGYRIKAAETNFDSIGIDTPADLRKAQKILNETDPEL
jgi:3-deoxy-manno-octulosonate cytidylyltransferase (CMP-KDO synthetase)